MEPTVVSRVAVRWIADRLMIGADSGGRTVALATWRDKEPAWQGIKPSDLLLIAAAACPMVDVVEILRKGRHPLVSLETECTGQQLADPPYTFTAIHIHFRVGGAIPATAVERALELSMDKYCSVVNTLRPGVAVSYDYELEP